MSDDSTHPGKSMDKVGQTRSDILLVAVISALAFGLRIIRASDPIGGFHSFNEAWYSIIATNYKSPAEFMFPQTVFGRVDYNVSPFLSQLLYLWGLIFGFTKSVFVQVPIIFSVMTCPVVFAIANRLFNRVAGLAAAAFYAAAPISALVGRNIQTDPVYVFFMMASLLAYLAATEDDKPRVGMMALAGLLFGMSFFTKQFAGILLPAIVVWETVRRRGLKWFGRGHIVFGLAALVFPGPFFIYHLTINRDVALGAQSMLSSSQYVSPGFETFMYILNEYIWGASPPIFILALIGIAAGLIKKFNSALLLLLGAVAFNWFFSHWHGHSYYILFLVPFICVAAGYAVSIIPIKFAPELIGGGVSIFAALLAIAIMCSIKYGYNDMEDVAKLTGRAESKPPVMILTQNLGGSYYPPLRYYCRECDIVNEEALGLTGKKEIVLKEDRVALIAGFGEDDRVRMPRNVYTVRRDAYGLFLFGRQFYAQMVSEHFLKVDSLKFFRNGPPNGFGVKKIGRYESIFLVALPPGTPMPFNNDGLIDFRLSHISKRTSPR